MSAVNDAVRASLFVADYNVRDMFGARQAPELELTEMLEQARAEAYLAGMEAAAKVCDKRAWLNDRPEPRDPEQEAMALEPRACAAAIRALAKEGER